MAVAVKSKAGAKAVEKEWKKKPNLRAPRPPADLLPSLADRLSPYSPAVKIGVLIEAVKVRRVRCCGVARVSVVYASVL